MKWLVVILCAGVLGWAGYDWLSDRMVQERISSAVALAIDDPRTRTIDQMRAEIAEAVRQQGVHLTPSQIGVIIASADRQPLAGEMVSRAGVVTSAQRVMVQVTYTSRLWGRSRPHVVERSKVFVAAATPAPGPQDTLLQQIP